MRQIDAAFDALERLVERSTRLMERLHPLVVHAGLLALAIIGIVALLKNHK